ncbi:MAG: hypothetical protein Q8936_22580 [Bacillota bacterium]|nr:hypothetical protein [Bacillota bacterium]
MDNKVLGLIELLDKLPIPMYGISDISELPELKNKFTRAISLAQAYSYTLDDYSSTGFNDFLLGKVKGELEQSIEIIEQFLQKENIAYRTIGNVQKDPVLSIGEFSHKYAAVKSGLGWIGKNGLLITKKYGPRVRLSTILIDLELPYNNQDEYNGCKECNACVNICPTKCLKGTIWNSSLQREDIIDVFNCKDKNETRKEYMCGLCLVACPIGKASSSDNKMIFTKSRD